MTFISRLFLFLCLIDLSLHAEPLHLKPYQALAPLLAGKLQTVHGDKLEDYAEPLDQYDYFFFYQQNFINDEQFTFKVLRFKRKVEESGAKVLFVFLEGDPTANESFSSGNNSVHTENTWTSKSINSYVQSHHLIDWPVLTSEMQKINTLVFCQGGDPIGVALYDKDGHGLRGEGSEMLAKDIKLDDFFNELGRGF